MALDYGWQNFYKAVRGSAASDIPVHERLKDAYLGEISILREEDVPSEVWVKLLSLRKALTCVDYADGRGLVDVAVAQMSKEEASQYLAEIVDMYDSVASAYYRSRIN